MLPKIHEVAAELAQLHAVYPKASVSTLASNLGYQPLLIMNGLAYGNEIGLFHYKQKKDKIIKGKNPWQYEVSSYIRQLAYNVRVVVVRENNREMDVSLDMLEQSWLTTTLPAHLKLAIRILEYSGEFITYELSDPDDLASLYTFITLKQNIDRNWGLKQFKQKK
jgi:hypothetical protein